MLESQTSQISAEPAKARFGRRIDENSKIEKKIKAINFFIFFICGFYRI